ncbi:MAG: type II toxin-antitoxin system PemK/MazF family toxin [Actinomycetota bacterium]|nr:type II toxin-antitoxin system PemK/MazF family toxin [Actinomycetota bacterium]
MRRGDVVWVDLHPVRRHEANKVRPAVIVSNDGANRRATDLGRGTVTVVPITSNTARVHPFQVELPKGSCGLSRESKAQAEQVRAVSVSRVGRVAGHLPPELLDQLDDALRLHLQA